MSSAWLRASLALWRRRERWRKRRHTYWHKRVHDARSRDVHPRQWIIDRRDHWSRLLDEARGMIDRRTRQLARKRKLAEEWGGSKAVIARVVNPILVDQYGLRITSEKRTNQATATGGTSDHWIGNTDAYAADYATYDGADAATAVARAFGQDDWRPGSYASFNTTVSGKQFRVQILWAVPGHYDHIHVGVKRIR